LLPASTGALTGSESLTAPVALAVRRGVRFIREGVKPRGGEYFVNGDELTGGACGASTTTTAADDAAASGIAA
jgi:hypothetical protein